MKRRPSFFRRFLAVFRRLGVIWTLSPFLLLIALALLLLFAFRAGCGGGRGEEKRSGDGKNATSSPSREAGERKTKGQAEAAPAAPRTPAKSQGGANAAPPAAPPVSASALVATKTPPPSLSSPASSSAPAAPPLTRQEKENRADAWVAIVKRVRRLCKHPEAVEFPAVDAPGLVFSPNEKGGFNVEAYYESRDEFGTKTRTAFRVAVHPTPNGFAAEFPEFP